MAPQIRNNLNNPNNPNIGGSGIGIGGGGGGNFMGPGPGPGPDGPQGVRPGDGGRVPNRLTGPNASEEMQRMLLNRPDVKAQAQAIMGSRVLQDADKKFQLKELLNRFR